MSFHPFPASRPRPILWILAAVSAALSILILAPGVARATCVSSTPSSISVADPPADAQPTAPEILSVDASLDSACRLTIDPKLQADLSTYQVVSIYLGFQPSTGDPNTETLDREVRVFPGGDAYLTDVDVFIPIATLPRAGQAGFTATLDALGVPAPTSLGIWVSAIYDIAYPPVWGDEPFDESPSIDSLMHRLPLSFAQPSPPPAPPPPPPPAKPAPVVQQAKGCVVPKLKGLTVKKAKAALRKAGCKYKLKGKGRVRSFSPKAGTRTEGTVQVKARKKKRRKRASRRSVVTHLDVRSSALRGQ
jgi:hypothetical protein